MFSSLTSLQPRQLFTQVLNFALVLSTAFMLWKGLSITTDSSSPIVVVLSGSMEPAFQRGDLLFLWNRGQDTKVGEIVVYNVKGKDIPIVHRVVRRFGGGSGYVVALFYLPHFPCFLSCYSSCHRCFLNQS
jgi:signal peptidase